LNANSEPSTSPPSHHGGNAGLPVPIVSVPAVLSVAALSAAQAWTVELFQSLLAGTGSAVGLRGVITVTST